MKLAIKLIAHFGLILLLSMLLSQFVNFDKNVAQEIQKEHQQLDKFIFEHLQQYH